MKRALFVSMLSFSGLISAIVACESAANLDVTYAPATAIDASTDADAGPPPGVAFEGCPCDESQGFGCCVVPKPDTPFCTLDKNECDQAKGMLLKCLRGRTDDECCLRGAGAGAISAYA